MNNFYHYTYKNGVQFVTTANPIIILDVCKEISILKEQPKLLGIWKFKKINRKDT